MSHFLGRKGIVLLVGIFASIAAWADPEPAAPVDALECGALAEIIVVGVRFAPQIAEGTGAVPGAVEAQLATWLGISESQLSGAALWLTAVGVGVGYALPPVSPGAWMESAGAWAAGHTVVPMWNACVRVWDTYRELPGDLASLGENLVDNGADGVALQGDLPASMAVGRSCLEKTGRWETLLGNLGLSYGAWRDCRSCCDAGIHDARYPSDDAAAGDYARNAPGWGSCMAVCNGLAHANGDARYLE
jgi:hypothetical protein